MKFNSNQRKWDVARLGDVTAISSGITLGRKLDGRLTRSIPYLRVANVKDGRLDLTEVKETNATEDEIQECRLERGDILLTEGGDPDKLGRGTYWQNEIPECIHQNHIFRVRSDHSQFDPVFLAFQFGSSYGKKYFLRHAKQTTGIASINKTVLSNFPLLIPPLTEQRRIATQLREQIAVVEKAHAAVQAQLDAAQKLPAALLRAIFASPTAERWPHRKLGELLTDCRNGLYKPDTFYGRGTPILKMFNIGRLDGRWELEKIDQIEVTPGEREQFGLRIGDIMFNRVNSRELVGKCAVVVEKISGAVFESKNMRLRLNGNLADSKFVATFLNSHFGRVQIEKRTRQIIGMATINRSDLDGFEIPMPAITEQENVIAHLDKELAGVYSLCDSLEAKLAEIELLPAALLRRAFSRQN